MHCSIKRKIEPFGKTRFYRGGGTVGGHRKHLMSLGGQEENFSSKENSPTPYDFKNERSLITSITTIEISKLPLFYCSVVYLIANSELKMIKFSSSFKLKEIQVVDSLFIEDPKNIIFFQRGPNFGGGTAGKFWKMGNNMDIYCYANRG